MTVSGDSSVPCRENCPLPGCGVESASTTSTGTPSGTSTLSSTWPSWPKVCTRVMLMSVGRIFRSHHVFRTSITAFAGFKAGTKPPPTRLSDLARLGFYWQRTCTASRFQIHSGKSQRRWYRRYYPIYRQYGLFFV
jgi:hypothetical protein